jgi:hypothetical protein
LLFRLSVAAATAILPEHAEATAGGISFLLAFVGGRVVGLAGLFLPERTLDCRPQLAFDTRPRDVTGAVAHGAEPGDRLVMNP